MEICIRMYCSFDISASDTHTHTHTQTCKHRQTGSSHCSSFVYTLTFSQHLSYVLYTFGKRGPFSNWGPYCSFCYKSPVWMHKQTHTHTVLCKVYTEDLHCSPLLFPLLLDLNFFRHLPLDLNTFFNRGHLLTINANRGPIVPLCYKSSVYPLHIPVHTQTAVRS